MESNCKVKTFNSKIPVAIRHQKFSDVSNGKSSHTTVSKTHASNSYKSLPKKNPLRDTKSQSFKSDKALNGKCVKDTKFYDKVTSAKTNAKNDSKKENQQLKLRTKPNVSEKIPSMGCNQKSKNADKLLKNKNYVDESIQKLSRIKVSSEKEIEKSKMSYLNYQKEIKFEANEIYRNMILSEKDISPNIGNLVPGFKLSSFQRPSFYQILGVPADPYKEAMKTIENASSARRDRKLKIQSPFKDRGSFYTPNPKMEAMRSIENFKLKQLQKSISKCTKKVTFDLNVRECTPKSPSDTHLKSFKNTDDRLTQISEKSEENTPNSPENCRIQPCSPVRLYKANKENSSICELSKESSISNQDIKTSDKNIKTNMYGTSCTPNTKFVPANLSTDSQFSPKYSYDDIELMPRTCTKYEQSLNTENINITKSRVYTPRPVSYFSTSKICKSSSPELLIKGASDTLLKFAPICTPFVLKSVAKNTMDEKYYGQDIDLSPVRLKLDFAEKDSPKKVTNHRTIINFENVPTYKNKLDQLADEECSYWLVNEGTPVICGRYLMNPVAMTLSEGDEMHFIPINF